MRLRALAASAILPALLLAPVSVRAGTTHVPADVATIQAALDGAQTGDEVEVASGVYHEAVNASPAANVVVRAKGNVRIDARGLGAAAFSVVGNNTQVFGLRVTGSDADGFVLGGANVQLTDCQASGVTGRGFVSQGTDVQVARCRVKKSGQDALVVQSGSNVTFTDCTVIAAGGAGIDIQGGTDVSVVRGKFVRVKTSGASIAASNVTIDASKFVAPAGDGILEQTGSPLSGNAYTNDHITKAGGGGIELVSAGVVVTANTVARPGGNGIVVNGDLAQVQTNTVTGAGGNGVLVSGDNGQYTGNKALGSKGNGFRLDGTGNVLSQNVGKGSRGLDLRDASGGANTVQPDNMFKHTGT